MKNGLGLTILIAVVLGLSVGCSKRQTRVDSFYGTSYQLAKESQINNPDAGIHTGPSVGLVMGRLPQKLLNAMRKVLKHLPPRPKPIRSMSAV